ncbi:MAG TPA: hypothetical protein VFV39_10330 [Limnobacter sp.]|nr:hypothetical protein [Limnobacter sp.]
MNNLKNAICLALTITLLACTSADSKSAIQGDWVIKTYRCAFGCVDVTEQFFKPYVGKTIPLSGGVLDDPYFGACLPEDLIVILKEVPTNSLLMERSEQLPEGMRFTRENTGINNNTVKAGQLACKDTKLGNRTILSILSATPEQIIALEEDGLLLVLEPVAAR